MSKSSDKSSKDKPSGEEVTESIGGAAEAVGGAVATGITVAHDAKQSKKQREQEIKSLNKELRILESERGKLKGVVQAELKEAQQASMGMGTTVLMAGSLGILGFGGIGIYLVKSKSKPRKVKRRRNPYADDIPIVARQNIIDPVSWAFIITGIVAAVGSMTGAGIAIGHKIIQKKKQEEHDKKVKELQKKIAKEEAAIEDLQEIIEAADAEEQEAIQAKNILLAGTLLTVCAGAGAAFLATRKRRR